VAERRRAWQNTFTTLKHLPLGAHTIDYAPVTDYTAPPSESISLVSGANSLTRSYTAVRPAYAVVKKLLRRRRHALHDSRSDGVLMA